MSDREEDDAAAPAGAAPPPAPDAAASIGRLGLEILSALDPLDPRAVALDVFEVYCHEQLATDDVGRRAFLIKKMKYMIDRLIGHQYDYGRLFNRTKLANLIARVCGRFAYPGATHVHHGVLSDLAYVVPDPLVTLAPDRWSVTLGQLVDLRDSLIRNDAALIVLPSEIDPRGDGAEDVIPEGDDGPNPKMAGRKMFGAEYDKLLDRTRFHAVLSNLQPFFYQAMSDDVKGRDDTVAVPRDNIAAFEAAIEEHFGDADDENRHKSILRSLLDNNESIQRPTRYGGLHLKSHLKLRRIHDEHANEFDLARFQSKFLGLLRRWNAESFPVPRLAALGYGATVNGDEDGERADDGVGTAAAEAVEQDCRKPAAVSSDKENEEARPAGEAGGGGDDDGIDRGDEEEELGSSPKKRARRRRTGRRPIPVATAAAEEEPAAKLPPRKRGRQKRSTDANELGEDRIEESSSDDDSDMIGKRWEEKESNASGLRRKRERLMKRVKDPLEVFLDPKGDESEGDADSFGDGGDGNGDVGGDGGDGKDDGGEEGVPAKTPTFRKSDKRTKTSLKFDSSDDEDGGQPSRPPASGGGGLSALPSRMSDPTTPVVDVPRPQPVNVNLTNRTGKRKKFTDEEDDAIKKGIKKFGAGKWAQIKAHYGIELADRSAINIKDRWRTLKKLGLN